MNARSRWLAVLAVAGAAAGWLFYGREEPPAAVRAPSLRASRERSSEVARIGLSRLEAPRGEARVGRRNLFAFGSAAFGRDDEEAPPPTLADAPPPITAPVSPPPPPLNVKYIGNLESREGLKVAVMLTDRREVLWGQVGDVLGNRFRIVKIGLESVDIQEMGSESIRRIPLRGN